MRRYELIEGSSSKFWEIELDGHEVTVRFGRIGTQGQTKTKSFGDAAAARKEHDKLVKEKTGKGYAEVAAAPGARLAAVGTPGGGDAAAPAAPVANAPAAAIAAASPTPAPPSPTASLPPAEATSAPTASAASASIAWPGGGFLWTNELRAELPVVRGIRPPPDREIEPSLAEPMVMEDDSHGYRTQHFAELAKLAGRRWQRWTAAEWTERQQRANLATTDGQAWLELCAQALCADAVLPAAWASHHRSHYYTQRYPIAWVTSAGLALHGLPFMVERALDLCRATRPHRLFGIAVTSMLRTLRDALAAADDATHDAVIALLEREAGATPTDRLVRAGLAPHRADWAVAAHADRDDPHNVLLTCALPVEPALEALKGVYPYMSYVKPTLLLQVHLHGDAAFPIFAHLIRTAQDRDNAEQFLSLAARMQVPELIHLLAELIERKEVRAALDKLSDRYPAAALKTVVERAFATRSRLAESWAVRLALREPAARASVMPALGAGDRERFEALLAALDVTEAATEQLPPLLREPPWLHKARAAELPTLAATPLPTSERLLWDEAERARHAAYKLSGWRSQQVNGPCHQPPSTSGP